MEGKISILRKPLTENNAWKKMGTKRGTQERRNTMSTREQIMQLLGSVKTEWALKKILSYIRIVIEKEDGKE